MGGLPGSGLPQDCAGDACGTGGDALRSSHARGDDPDRLVRQAGSVRRSDRRRYRHALQPHRPYPDLDLRGQPAGLACRSRALAGRRRARSRTSFPTPCTSGLTERFIDRRTSVLMRRLRENAQLEPEMGKTGDVIVEGHAIGRLDGFVFIAGCVIGRFRSQGACRTRRKRRWPARSPPAPCGLRRRLTGNSCWPPTAPCAGSAQPVGKLVAGEEALRPRVRVIADEHLSGAPREAVEARLDDWVKSHIEKLLGPLFELSAAAGHQRHRTRRCVPIGRSARRARAGARRR